MFTERANGVRGELSRTRLMGAGPVGGLSRTRLSSGSVGLASIVAMSADHASDLFLDTASAPLHVPRPFHAPSLRASSVKTIMWKTGRMRAMHQRVGSREVSDRRHLH